MKADNSLQQQLSASSAQVANTYCPPKKGPPQPSFQLTIYQMGGVFVLYLAGVVVGFVIYLGELVYNKVVLKGVDPNTGACGVPITAMKPIKPNEPLLTSCPFVPTDLNPNHYCILTLLHLPLP